MDRELYLPKSWTDDPDRCRAAKIPTERAFATKGELARHLVLRALASDLPIAWVTADFAYGQEWGFRRMLEEAGVGYVLAVPKSQQVKSLVGSWRIDQIVGEAPDNAWQRLSAGDGAKGPRLYDWASAQLPVIDFFDGNPPAHRRWVLARRSIKRPDEIAYYLAYAPTGTNVAELARIAGSRWAIEECFQAAKSECGLDEYEVRRYPGWTGTSPLPCSRTPPSGRWLPRKLKGGPKKRSPHSRAPHRGRNPEAHGNLPFPANSPTAEPCSCPVLVNMATPPSSRRPPLPLPTPEPGTTRIHRSRTRRNSNPLPSKPGT
ncbi:DDE superfamily endonuclease [Streptomyces sp. ok210]|nr:DDE superfamily endonuclease [Streptomyces sp. ok210]